MILRLRLRGLLIIFLVVEVCCGMMRYHDMHERMMEQKYCMIFVLGVDGSSWLTLSDKPRTVRSVNGRISVFVARIESMVRCTVRGKGRLRLVLAVVAGVVVGVRASVGVLIAHGWWHMASARFGADTDQGSFFILANVALMAQWEG